MISSFSTKHLEADLMFCFSSVKMNISLNGPTNNDVLTFTFSYLTSIIGIYGKILGPQLLTRPDVSFTFPPVALQ